MDIDERVVCIISTHTHTHTWTSEWSVHVFPCSEHTCAQVHTRTYAHTRLLLVVVTSVPAQNMHMYMLTQAVMMLK
jgi:hypothetical protein